MRQEEDPGRWLSIHILIEDDSIEGNRRCPRTYERQILQKMIQLRSMMKMIDNVPKIPMTYRVSPESCTIVVAVVFVVEYLPS